MQIKIAITFLKTVVPPVQRIYFKRFKVNNRKAVPSKGPVIFAPNHQNAFLDAVIVGASTPRGPWFLTRASVFKTSTARFFLNELRMLAIYRFRDGLSQVKKNDEVINRCIDKLEKKESLLIFVEGNHDMRYSLRPLQKGIARISLGAELKHDFDLGVKIIPTGLQYDDHSRFRSNLLVNFGDPISLADYADIYKEDPVAATDKLLKDLSEKMSELIINIPAGKSYDETLNQFYKYRTKEKNLLSQLHSDKNIIRKIINNDAGDLKLSPPKKRTNPLLNIIAIILGFPVFVYGAITHILPWLIIRKMVSSLVKDPAWIASIKFVNILFLVPLFYIIYTLLFYYLTGWIWISLAFLLSLPITGLIAYYYLYKYVIRASSLKPQASSFKLKI